MTPSSGCHIPISTLIETLMIKAMSTGEIVWA